MPQSTNNLDFLTSGSVLAAPQLIGWRLYKREGNDLVGGVIRETEAYTQTDAASHSYRGKTARTEVMFGPAGYIYVYFTYGMHHCMNIVTGADGTGDGVLIRAITPNAGLPIIRSRRNTVSDTHMTDGPGKLCQALGITLQDNGKQLNASDILLLPPLTDRPAIQSTPRIGISKDTHRLWRFVASE